jgi:hypothetical protein
MENSFSAGFTCMMIYACPSTDHSDVIFINLLLFNMYEYTVAYVRVYFELKRKYAQPHAPHSPFYKEYQLLSSEEKINHVKGGKQKGRTAEDAEKM